MSNDSIHQGPVEKQQIDGRTLGNLKNINVPSFLSSVYRTAHNLELMVTVGISVTT